MARQTLLLLLLLLPGLLLPPGLAMAFCRCDVSVETAGDSDATGRDPAGSDAVRADAGGCCRPAAPPTAPRACCGVPACCDIAPADGAAREQHDRKCCGGCDCKLTVPDATNTWPASEREQLPELALLLLLPVRWLPAVAQNLAAWSPPQLRPPPPPAAARNLPLLL